MTRKTGKFIWFECTTPDRARAKAFYAEVFGWRVQSHPMGETSYDMITAGETPIGGYAAPDNGTPPHWTTYVSVDDVDATVARARALGGRSLVAAFDVPEVGRMAKLADPQGATFWVMRGTSDDSPDTPSVAGAFHWNELWTRNAEQAVTFYTELLGYTDKKMDMPDGAYHVLEKGSAPRGGVMTAPDPKVPPMWLPYVHVDDCDLVASRAKRLGATIHVPPTDIAGIGRFTVFADPVGATIAAIRPAPHSA